MQLQEYEEIKKHISILNVAYQTHLEIVSEDGFETQAICPFCEYKETEKEGYLTLNSKDNTYHCVNCKKKGYSIRSICDFTRT